MKHIFGRIVAYIALYFSVIFGIFVLQFTKGQLFSVTLGAMTITGRQERTEAGKTTPLLPLHIVSNGLDLYISEQNPVYAVDDEKNTVTLKVLEYKIDENENRFSVHCSEKIVMSFFSEERGESVTLRIEASLPENIQTVMLPWKITQNAGIERSNGKIFVRSGKKQYAFIGSFGFNTETQEITEQSEIPHLELGKMQPVAYYKAYLPFRELDIHAISEMVQSSVEVYEKTTDSFALAALNAGQQALSAKKINEKTAAAYIAEMGRRNTLFEALQKAPAQTLAKSARTYFTSPFYGNVQETHAGLAADDAKKRELYSSLIKSNNPAIFEYEDLIPFLTDRGDKHSIEELFRMTEQIDINTFTVRQAAGILSAYIDCSRYYPDKKAVFENMLPFCEKKITKALLLIDEGLYLSGDGVYIDSATSLISSQILMRYGAIQSEVWQSVARMLVTSLLRYSGESAGLPTGFTVTGENDQLGLIADDSSILDAGILYPLVIPENSWYPHAQSSLALQAEPGIWAWTCAKDIEVLEKTAKTLVLRIRFPAAHSHYLTLHGIQSFYRIELYGIPFRSDSRFEMYNSSGYAYNAAAKILYLKMVHKNEYETIRLSLGTPPWSKPASTSPIIRNPPSDTATVPPAGSDSAQTPPPDTGEASTKPAEPERSEN